MGSPVTLSGFNQIDFNQILNAIMQRERLPVVRLEDQRRSLEAQKSAYAVLASKLAALESAAADLRAADALEGRTATVSDPGRLTASADASAPEGTYEVLVLNLARSQVTTSATAYADSDVTVVADGGSLTVNGVEVVLSGPTTLQSLATAINGAGTGVSASVIRTADGYRLMLTGAETGTGAAFTVTSGLTGGQPIVFNATNDQQAQDAVIRFNGVEVTSASNSFAAVVNGLSLTVLRQDPHTPVVLTITASADSVKALVEKVTQAFRDLTTFLDEQASSASADEGIGRDPLVRGLRRQIASILSAQYGESGFSSLAQVGLSFARTGELTFDPDAFARALAADEAGVQALFRGPDGVGGAFGTLAATIAEYTRAGGLVPGLQNRLGTQLQNLATRIVDFEARLTVRREALLREFIAADEAIAQLNAARAQLSTLGTQFSLF